MTITELTDSLPQIKLKAEHSNWQANYGLAPGLDVTDITEPAEKDKTSYSLLVWDKDIRGETPLKELLLNAQHPAWVIFITTTELAVLKATVEVLNNL